MSNQNKSGMIYYQVLQGSRLLLADECNKKKLLDIVQETFEKEDRWMAVFCVTDQDVHFMHYAASKEAATEILETIRAQFLRTCSSTLPVIDGVINDMQIAIPIRLNTEKKIMEHCRMIHRLPLDLEYVERLADYWWSSYLNYIEIYHWNRVKCSGILRLFADNQEDARTKMQYYHKRGKKKQEEDQYGIWKSL